MPDSDLALEKIWPVPWVRVVGDFWGTQSPETEKYR